MKFFVRSVSPVKLQIDKANFLCFAALGDGERVGNAVVRHREACSGRKSFSLNCECS